MSNEEGFFLSPGLYIMAAAILLTTCDNNDKIDNIERKFNESKLEIQARDVIGRPDIDKFYDINGQRVYLEIDGMRIEEYFR